MEQEAQLHRRDSARRRSSRRSRSFKVTDYVPVRLPISG